MAEIKAVKEPTPDPKVGKPKRYSGVSFPYYTLERSVEVAKVMYERAGGVCDRPQLAAFLGYKGTNNGGFLSRVAAAKMFGLVEQEGDNVKVSPRGMAIVAQISEADAERAKAEAFLAVDLFKRVYEQYKGGTLPAEAGLKNLLETQYSVVHDRVAPTVTILIQSARYAGFFKAGPDRMVMPVIVKGATPPPVEPPSVPRKNGGGGGGGDDVPPNIHPAIFGLLRELPAAGTAMTSKRRAALISAFTAMVGFIYPEAEIET